ncbi:MAG: hypothetical protein ACK4RS_02195 [Thiothrix sp.]
MITPFRVALVVESEYLAAWQHLMLTRLLALDAVTLTAVVVQPARPKRFLQRVKHYLLQGLHWLDAHLFSTPLHALQLVTWLDLVGDIPIYQRDSPRFQQWVVASEHVELVLDLSQYPPSADLLTLSRYGVWRVFHGKAIIMDARYCGVDEYAQCVPEIGSGLLCWRHASASAELLFYATTSTDGVSLNRSIERTLWKMADFVPQRVQELLQVGATAFFSHTNRRYAPEAMPQFVTLPAEPSFARLARVGWQYPLNLARKLYTHWFCHEQWVLLARDVGGSAQDICLLEQFRKWMPPSDRFWADPFLISHAGQQYVFFEELLYSRGIGHLACMRLNADGSHSEPVTILERPYHLSYPFIFEYQGQYYLIPETAANQTIEVYRCEEFPQRWVLEKTLMGDVEAYDATLLEHAGRWWMFVSMRSHPNCSPSEALYLFYSDSPLSTHWQAHPQNPVVAQASLARPAGRIFEENGQLYRPSQNCAGMYGRGLNINRILQLDTQHYREETVSRCVPDGACNLNGVHTLGLGEQVTISDAVHVHHRFDWLQRWMAKLA